MRSTTKRPDLGVAIAGAAFALALLALPFLFSGEPAAAPPVPIPPQSRPDAAEPVPAVPLLPSPSPDGLRLHGLLGTGAIIGFPNGAQRWVPLGREVIPGLRLQEVRQHQAILVSSAGIIELSLDGRATQAAAPPAAPAAAQASLAARRDEILHYRFGLAPERAGGRIAGFAIRPEADLPVLRRAGLRPGDVLVSVNGQSFDSQERVQELAGEIAGSFTAEFEFLRGGRRMRTSLEVNPRN